MISLQKYYFFYIYANLSIYFCKFSFVCQLSVSKPLLHNIIIIRYISNMFLIMLHFWCEIFFTLFSKIFGQFKKKQYLCMLILDKSVA